MATCLPEEQPLRNNNKSNQEMVEHIIDVLHHLALKQRLEDWSSLPATIEALLYMRDIEYQLQLMEAEYIDCSLGLHNLQ